MDRFTLSRHHSEEVLSVPYSNAVVSGWRGTLWGTFRHLNIPNDEIIRLCTVHQGVVKAANHQFVFFDATDGAKRHFPTWSPPTWHTEKTGIL